MRFYEWLTFVFFLTFVVIAWTRPLPARRRTMITVNAAAGIAALWLLQSTRLRNWLPLGFIPLAYWQTGYFVLPINQKLQSKLQSFDQRFLRSLQLGPTVNFWLELAYLLVYPLVPAGLIALYAAGMGHVAEEFWNVVLPPAYMCYATFPFIQTLPPRAIEQQAMWEPKRTRIRILNLFVLRHVSIQANTFPSGHVAASLAMAFELLRHAPLIGIVFLIIAIAIAGGAFVGRYHYGLDVLIGAALAGISFWLV
jgi:membrane-associated phospholipid phosphatase